MSTTIRLDDELQVRVDAARGDVPRERFCRSLISEALTQREVAGPQGQPPFDTPSSLPPEVRAGASDDRRVGSADAAFASRVPSSEARAGVAPRPKGGKR